MPLPSSKVCFSCLDFISLNVTWRSCGLRYIIKGTVLLIWKEWEVTNLNYSSFVAKSSQERIKEMKRVQGLSLPVSFSEVVSNTARSILTSSLWKLPAEENVTYSLIHLLACPLSLQIKMSRLTRLSTLLQSTALSVLCSNIVTSTTQTSKFIFPA